MRVVWSDRVPFNWSSSPSPLVDLELFFRGGHWNALQLPWTATPTLLVPRTRTHNNTPERGQCRPLSKARVAIFHHPQKSMPESAPSSPLECRSRILWGPSRRPTTIFACIRTGPLGILSTFTTYRGIPPSGMGTGTTNSMRKHLTDGCLHWIGVLFIDITTIIAKMVMRMRVGSIQRVLSVIDLVRKIWPIFLTIRGVPINWLDTSTRECCDCSDNDNYSWQA